MPHSKQILRQNSRQNSNAGKQHSQQLQSSNHYNIPHHYHNTVREKMNATNSKADPIALNFKDTCLRTSDVQLLQGPHWLNDQIISFYYDYLEHIKYKSNPDLLFVAPEVTQCMKYMDDADLEGLLANLKASRKPFIFFVLNDNENKTSGGSHWSLLVLSRPEKTFFHFDSYGNNNTEVSQGFMKRIKDFLGLRQSKFRPTRCLQQANSYDCGIHVICMTDNIADYVNRYECIDGLPSVHTDSIKAKRSELLKLIQSLGGKT